MTVISATPAAPAAQPDLSTLPVRVDRKTAAELFAAAQGKLDAAQPSRRRQAS